MNNQESRALVALACLPHALIAIALVCCGGRAFVEAAGIDASAPDANARCVYCARDELAPGPPAFDAEIADVGVDADDVPQWLCSDGPCTPTSGFAFTCGALCCSPTCPDGAVPGIDAIAPCPAEGCLCVRGAQSCPPSTPYACAGACCNWYAPGCDEQ